MRPVRRFVRRLTSWTTSARDEEILRAEIDDHLTRQTADNLRAGMTASEARRQALLKFGHVDAIKERYRDQRGLPFAETLLRDTRHALRRLRRTPAFTAAVLLTLALGIGANTAIFGVIDSILIRPLAYPNADALVAIRLAAAGMPGLPGIGVISYGLYLLAGLCWLPVVWIQHRMMRMLERKIAGEGFDEFQFERLRKAWFLLGWPAFGGLVFVFYLMVAKPL